MQKAKVNGAALAYEDRGQGRPVLLLHGFPLSSRSFRPQLEALSGKYRFIVPDHRGFGASPPDPGLEALEMRIIARDALALLDHLGIREAVVGGVSMGGYAAMALLREDAGRVKGLVLADTHPAADDEDGKARREESAQAVLERGTEVLIDAMLPKLLAPSAPDALRNEVQELIFTNSAEGCAAAQRGMARRPDSREVLSRYAGPALVVVGSEDAITPPAKARAMAELMSAASLVEIPGAGHLSNLEAPAEFNRALESFLGKIRW